MTLKVEYAKLSELKPLENNAKLHPVQQVNEIIESIKEFGFNDPLGIDENGVIIEGNGRYAAAQKMGLEEVPIIRLVGLTEEQKRAYALVHNKLAMNTGFDLEKLDAELAAITSIRLDKMGFDEVQNFDWDTVDELTEDFYLPPDKHELRCPHCGGVDSKERFMKAKVGEEEHVE